MAFAAARMGESCLKGLSGTALTPCDVLRCCAMLRSLMLQRGARYTMLSVICSCSLYSARLELCAASGIPAVECAYVASTVTEVPFFATKVTLGPEGIGEVHGTGPLSAFEAEGVKKLLPDLTKQIAKGVEFAKA